VYLMGRSVVNDSGTAWLGRSTPAVHWTLGTTRYGSYPSLYLYAADGTRKGSLAPKATTIPTDTWIDADVSLSEEGVVASVNGVVVSVECDMRAQLDAAGGLVLSLLQTSDQDASGIDIDSIVVEQVVEPPVNQNASPIAVAGDDRSAFLGESVTLDGSASTDPDGEIVGWAWDLGDGTAASGTGVSHVYAAAGHYHVTLTVTDDEGATDEDGLEVRILTALDGLYALRAEVQAAELANPAKKETPGYKVSLLTKLDLAIKARQAGDLKALEQSLGTFAAELNPSQVPQGLIDEWHTDVDRIIAAARADMGPTTPPKPKRVKRTRVRPVPRGNR